MPSVVDSIVTACMLQRELLRRQLKTIQLVAGHRLLVTRVIHDELPGPEVERGLLEQQVVTRLRQARALRMMIICVCAWRLHGKADLDEAGASHTEQKEHSDHR